MKDLQPSLWLPSPIVSSRPARACPCRRSRIWREGKGPDDLLRHDGRRQVLPISGELLNDVLGIDMEAVHYPGGTEVMIDMGGGRIDVVFSSLTDLARGIGTPVAVMSEERSTALPDVPTVSEAGFPATLVPTGGASSRRPARRRTWSARSTKTLSR